MNSDDLQQVMDALQNIQREMRNIAILTGICPDCLGLGEDRKGIALCMSCGGIGTVGYDDRRDA